MSFERPVSPETSRIACMTLAQLARGTPWRIELSHARDAHLIVWMTRGQGLATIQGVRRGIGTHNALFIPAGTLMALHPGPQGFGQAVLIPTALETGLPAGPAHLRIRDSAAQADFTGLIDAMNREGSARRSHSDAAQLAYARLMAIWLHRQIDSAPPAPPPGAAERLVRRYADLLAVHFRSDRLMGDYAEALGVTPTHLTRACRDSAGRTAADLLTECTLHAAREMLERPEPAIQDVARLLGFNSPAYFARFIQHHTGKTPTDLRRPRPPAG